MTRVPVGMCLESGRNAPAGLWHECELRPNHDSLHRCPCGSYWQTVEDDPECFEAVGSRPEGQEE